MEKVLWGLVEEVGGRLRSEKFFARCLTVKIRYTDFQTITRSRTLSAPTCFDKEIFEAVSRSAPPKHQPRQSGAPAGRERQRAAKTGWQEPLLNRDKRKSFAKLYEGIDELRRKYGEDAIGAATPRHKAG